MTRPGLKHPLLVQRAYVSIMADSLVITGANRRRYIIRNLGGFA